MADGEMRVQMMMDLESHAKGNIQKDVVAVVSAVPVLQASNHEVEVHKVSADVSLPTEVLEAASLLMLPLSMMDKEPLMPEVSLFQLQ